MKQSVFVKFVMPFIQWYALMIILTISIDYFLHRFQLVPNSSYLGIAGTLLIFVSFIYSLRKRKIIKTGSPKSLLILHEYLAWAGSVILLVHAGIHFNAILPWLAILMLLINVASGLVGKYLLKKANETMREKKQELIKLGISKEETDKKLFWDSITVDLMRKWRVVHLPISLLLVLLALFHILTIIIFSK
jgi:divalent metal cation (Fe/Co/Zn/Cd) transporter